MQGPLKQSTSFELDIKALDSTGEPVTGIVDGSWTKRIKKTGGSFGAMTVTITETEKGWYKLTLDTGHTDTLGCLSLTFEATGVKQVNERFRVEAQLVSDVYAFGAPPSAATIASAAADVALSGHTTSGSLAKAISDTFAFGPPPTAASMKNAVLDEALAGHTMAGTVGKKLNDAALTSDVASATSTLAGDITSAVAPLATAAGLTSAVAPLATAAQVASDVAPLATAAGLTSAVAPLATSAGLTSAVAPLATAAEVAGVQSDTDDIQTHIAALPTSSDLAAAVAPLATASGLSTVNSNVSAVGTAVVAIGSAVSGVAAATVAALAAFSHDTGLTQLGLWRRLEWLVGGKTTGENGPHAVGYRVDGVTKAVEFDHDPDAGTRAAGTRYGD